MGTQRYVNKVQGVILLDRRQAVTESNLWDVSSNIHCFSATKGSGSKGRNIRAHASVHSATASADGTQEGEIMQEGELVHHVK